MFKVTGTEKEKKKVLQQKSHVTGTYISLEI
jgi:hypothetical protein